MRTAFLDGVPVFFADAPPPLSVGLVFGVGRRDESFVAGGVTHLVEHLTMRAVGRTIIDANASVDLTVTEFTATGPPERVVAFLRAVCETLADLPTEGLGVEADVLRAEGGMVTTPAVGLLLGELYGSAGAGLASVREPAIRSLDPGAVRNWTRRFFHRGNAALWLSGPVPDGLCLPLPDGPAPTRPEQHRRMITTPAWGRMPVDERVVLGAELPSHPALGATLGVLRERLELELRHRRGLAYAVQVDKIGLDRDRRVLVVSTDARAGNEALAAQVLWREVHRLADQGPTVEEVDRERAEAETFLDDPRSVVDEARATAHARVSDVPVPTAGEIREEAAALTPNGVREVAGRLRGAALLLVPEHVDRPAPDLALLPEWSSAVVAGRVFSRKRLRGVSRDARLVVGEEGASVVLDDDRRITVLWREAVGLVRQAPDEWLLLGSDGFSLPLCEADWRGGAEAAALVRAAVPPGLQVVDDEAGDDGLLLVRAPSHRVREAVVLGRYGATLVGNGEWTAVLADGQRPAGAVADDLSVGLGRRTTAIVLRRTHADLEYVLLRGAKEVDRHRWGMAPGDHRLLARATSRPESHTAWLLGRTGAPEEVLQHAVVGLGLPPEVPALLDGGAPGRAERAEGRGLAGGLAATVRGEFTAPEGTGGVMDGWRRLSRRRPAWFRALNGLGALLAAVGLWFLLTVPDLLRGWGVVAGVLYGIGLLNCLWDTRPPRRRGDVATAPLPQQPTLTG